MHAPRTLQSARSRVMRLCTQARSHRSHLTSPLLAVSTSITASISAMAASFTTPSSHMDFDPGLWKTFLWKNSREAAASRSDTPLPGLIVAKWWTVRGRVWAKADIVC